MSQLTIVEAFADLTDTRRTARQRHAQSLCLALFTLAVAAGNRGFLAIGDWLKAYHAELVTLFEPPKGRLPSYSTIRRTLLRIEYQTYSAYLDDFFEKRLVCRGLGWRGLHQWSVSSSHSQWRNTAYQGKKWRCFCHAQPLPAPICATQYRNVGWCERSVGVLIPRISQC